MLASHRITPSGPANYYFEEHCDFAGFNFPVVASLIFEGVFDRFPKLKIVMVELALVLGGPVRVATGHAYRVMRDEVSHLQPLPSEYLATTSGTPPSRWRSPRMTSGSTRSSGCSRSSDG